MAVFTIGLVSCYQDPELDKQNENISKKEVMITEQDIWDAQKKWGDGIVKIGRIHSEGGNYRDTASAFIEDNYGYSLGEVLFKPTMAYKKQFRTDFDGALSYFIGGNPNYPEDKGFAIKPWIGVRWESAGTKIMGNVALAMGNYYLTPKNGGEEVKVEYTFAYTKDDDRNMLIIMHGSHFPYKPEEMQ